MIDLFRETPIEEHTINGTPIFVKREDLCAVHPMPPLSKMRGVLRFIEGRMAQVKTFGILDTRISKSGQGVAVICGRLGLGCRYYFPLLVSQKEFSAQWYVAGEQPGTELVPMHGGRTAVLRAQATRDCQMRGILMLPQGLPLFESVLATAEVLATVPSNLLRGTICLSTGTGTILSGLILGLAQRACSPCLLGVSASMSTDKQRALIQGHLSRAKVERLAAPEEVDRALSRLTLLKGLGDYYTPGRFAPPWPAHPFYEFKALDTIVPLLPTLPRPILFWNIGS